MRGRAPWRPLRTATCTAAPIWGTASAPWEAIGTRLPLVEEERIAGPASATREVLGQDVFATAWEEGRTLPLDQVVTEALTLGSEFAMHTPTKNQAD